MKRRTWTDARLALMAGGYQHSTDAAAFLARLNAEVGEPIPSIGAVQAQACKMRLHKTPEATAVILAKCQEQGRQVTQPEGRPLTPEREAMIRADYPTWIAGRAAFLARINALPGPAIRHHGTVRQWAVSLGVRRNQAAIDAVRMAALQQRVPGKPGRPARSEQQRQRGAMQARDASMARSAFVEVMPDTPDDLTAEQQAAIADSAARRKYEQARRLIAQKKSPAAVAAAVGIPLWRAFAIVGELRMEKQ